jgi:hypothetical protein
MLNALIERCGQGTYIADKRSQVSALNELFATAGAFLGGAGILCITVGALDFGRGDREGSGSRHSRGVCCCWCWRCVSSCELLFWAGEDAE